MVGESDVVLEKDILAEKSREFLPTWGEWAAQNREQVFREAGVNNGIVALFLVPATEDFFITSAFLQNEGGENSILHKDPTSNQSNTIAISRSLSTPLQFPMPIKINGGNQISLSVLGIGNVGRASVQGFRIPKRIS